MKKMIGVILTLAVLLSGFALADTAAQPVEVAEHYMLISLQSADGGSLALIGSGDGSDAFAAFSSDAGTYQARFEDFWKKLSLLQPALELKGGAGALAFEPALDGSMTMVTLNGVVIARLQGLETFAILSGSGSPSVDDGCSVRLWTPNGGAADEKICPRCGMIDDGSAKHDAVISQFCDEGHTECMGNPLHHCDVCGKDYVCSRSNSHTTCAKCGKAWCDKSEGDHTELPCGHRGCEVYGEAEKHGLCEICGKALCDGKDHTAAECGRHHAADGGDHGLLSCGHYVCEVGEEGTEGHAACEAGDGYLCDGLNHEHAGNNPSEPGDGDIPDGEIPDGEIPDGEIPDGDITIEGDAA